MLPMAVAKDKMEFMTLLVMNEAWKIAGKGLERDCETHQSCNTSVLLKIVGFSIGIESFSSDL